MRQILPFQSSPVPNPIPHPPVFTTRGPVILLEHQSHSTALCTVLRLPSSLGLFWCQQGAALLPDCAHRLQSPVIACRAAPAHLPLHLLPHLQPHHYLLQVPHLTLILQSLAQSHPHHHAHFPPPNLQRLHCRNHEPHPQCHRIRDPLRLHCEHLAPRNGARAMNPQPDPSRQVDLARQPQSRSRYLVSVAVAVMMSVGVNAEKGVPVTSTAVSVTRGVGVTRRDCEGTGVTVSLARRLPEPVKVVV